MNYQGSPTPFRRLPPQSREAMRRELEAVVAKVDRRRPHRTAVIGGATAFIVLGTGAGAAVYLRHESVTNKSYARCYTTDSVGSGTNFVGTTIAEAGSPGKPGQVNNALSVCSALWREGIIGPNSGPSGNVSRSTTYPVPNLAVCRMPDGTAAVFPGDAKTCAKLGLPVAQG
jgi:hypothetical protein